MRHINLTDRWQWTTRGFYCQINFGEHLQDDATLEVQQGLEPTSQTYVLWRGGLGNQLLYAGSNQELAEKLWHEKDPEGWVRDQTHFPSLLEGSFSIEDCKVVAQPDETPRILLTFGQAGGYRGDVALIGEETTCQILHHVYAGRQERATAIAAVLEPGQKLTMYVHGRGQHEYVTYFLDADGNFGKTIEVSS